MVSGLYTKVIHDQCRYLDQLTLLLILLLDSTLLHYDINSTHEQIILFYDSLSSALKLVFFIWGVLKAILLGSNEAETCNTKNKLEIIPIPAIIIFCNSTLIGILSIARLYLSIQRVLPVMATSRYSIMRIVSCLFSVIVWIFTFYALLKLQKRYNMKRLQLSKAILQTLMGTPFILQSLNLVNIGMIAFKIMVRRDKPTDLLILAIVFDILSAVIGLISTILGQPLVPPDGNTIRVDMVAALIPITFPTLLLILMSEKKLAIILMISHLASLVLTGLAVMTAKYMSPIEVHTPIPNQSRVFAMFSMFTMIASIAVALLLLAFTFTLSIVIVTFALGSFNPSVLMWVICGFLFTATVLLTPFLGEKRLNIAFLDKWTKATHEVDLNVVIGPAYLFTSYAQYLVQAGYSFLFMIGVSIAIMANISKVPISIVITISAELFALLSMLAVLKHAHRAGYRAEEEVTNLDSPRNRSRESNSSGNRAGDMTSPSHSRGDSPSNSRFTIDNHSSQSGTISAVSEDDHHVMDNGQLSSTDTLDELPSEPIRDREIHRAFSFPYNQTSSSPN